MKLRTKAISINLIPTFEHDDVVLAAKLLLGWGIKGNTASDLKKMIAEVTSGANVFLFENGRSSLYQLLRAIDIEKGDEVIVQGLTCSVVPGAIMAAGAKPIYVDIDNSYNMDAKLLPEKITDKTRAVIVQHSFGQPADVEKIKKICDENKLVLIEDLAHGLGGQYKDRKLGSWGEAAILSFGRDKVVSGICGGAVVSNNKKISTKISEKEAKLRSRDNGWVIKQLRYAVITALIINSYNFLYLGKSLHWLIRRMKLLSEPISMKEKSGEIENPDYRLDDRLAALVLNQISKIEKYINHRKKLAKHYTEALGVTYYQDHTYLRFCMEVEEPAGLRESAAIKGIFLGDWCFFSIKVREVQIIFFPSWRLL